MSKQKAQTKSTRQILSMIATLIARYKGAAAGGSLAIILAVFGLNDTEERKSIMTLPRDVFYQVETLSQNIEHLSNDIEKLSATVKEGNRELKGMVQKNSDRIDAVLLKD